MRRRLGRQPEHTEGWWGTPVGWDERDLIGWFETAGFSRIEVEYEVTSGGRTRKPKKADIAAGFRGRRQAVTCHWPTRRALRSGLAYNFGMQPTAFGRG